MTESSVKKMRKWSVLIILLILVTGAISWAFALDDGDANDMIIVDNTDTETTNPTTPSKPNVPDVVIPEATEPEKVEGESEKPEPNEEQPSNPTEPEVAIPEVEVPSVPEATIPDEPEVSDDTNVSDVPEEPEVFDEKHEHAYDTDVIAATCTTDGYTVYKCECGDSYTDDVVPAFGHEYESTPVAPTCTNDGYTISVCGECGNRSVDNYVPATGHSYGDWVIDKEATCTENGVEIRGCACCAMERREIEATGHLDDNKNYTCDVCGEDMCVDHVEEVIPAVAPTCTEPGKTEGKKCAVCGDTLVAQKTVDALGHDYESVVTAPTCTERGYTTYTCHCGNNYIDNYVKADGHEMGEWQSVTRSSCTDNGKEMRYCNNCDHSESRIVESVGHNHEAVSIVAATCTTDGYTTYACACGDSYTSDVVAATGHNYVSEVVAPTYESEGYTIHTCSNCGDSYKDNFVDALIPEGEEEEGCGEHKGCCGHHDAHRHKEVKIGKYLYVYCDHVTSIYRSADGLIIFYPYELYN